MTRKDRIEQIKNELEVLSNGPVTFGASPDMPEEAQERFLLEVLAYHRARKAAAPDDMTRDEREDKRH